MDEKIQKKLRFLEAYVVVSMLLFAVLIFIAAKTPDRKVKFDEIDAQRINILGRDGKLRLVISNNERSPGPIIGGMTMKTREGKRGAGLIFFNDQGDECGGMTWHGKEENGKINAGGGLMFDQFNQDQTVGITYSQVNDQRTSGLRVWERSLTPMAAFAKKVNDIELMKDGPAKTEAMKRLRAEAVASGMGGAERVFVGRNTKDAATVSLADPKGKPRLLLSVDGAGTPSLEFLDEDGKVIYRLPNDSATPNK